jgi:hypothetical protein
MIHELRVYRALPGRLPLLIDRFKDRTTKIWDRLGIQHVGFWTTMIGDSESSDLTYLLAWESLADRETRWGVFLKDAEWLQVRAESEKGGPLYENIKSQLLQPTSFSRLK